ncbi:MAG: excinuclease ABC subunit UvrA [Bacteroidota bacterium]|nr:excinuclease ABC subunit UvrA [Bacteroidota bacterium]
MAEKTVKTPKKPSKSKASTPPILSDLNPDNVEHGSIDIYGAREHNLKDIDLSIPRNKLVVFTGLSGSGKSSLAFDTVYAEGQRRYMETFSSYARQFMGNMKRPDVDKINGLSPVISIEQKTVSKNPRSTVGTITEIYDFLRLLYARASDAYSYETGAKMIKFTDDQIVAAILEEFNDDSVYILAPLVKRRKGHYRELFEQLQKSGYTRVRIDAEVQDIVPKMQLSRYKIHDIDLVIDRVKVSPDSGISRLKGSLQLALQKGKGLVTIATVEADKEKFYSRNLMCPDTGISYEEPQPNTFSFNSPYGWCPRCKGLGYSYQFELKSIFPDPEKSIKNGGIAPYGKDMDYWTASMVKAVLKKHGYKGTEPVGKLSEEVIQELLYGSEEKLTVDYSYAEVKAENKGLVKTFEDIMIQPGTSDMKEALQAIGYLADCPECEGYRLKKEALFFKFGELNIGQAALLQLDVFLNWIQDEYGKLIDRQKLIATEIVKELITRTQFLIDVGLQYLALHRPAFSLSGGEAQRIRLATQIGSQLINVTYILDEPSIGLHQRDNVRLISALKNLRDIGNSVIVVEHDKDMISEADYVVDLGPGAGVHGGRIVASGTPQEFLKGDSLTVQYMNGTRQINMPTQRRAGNGNSIVLKGATGHNLKNVNISLPLGTMICVTGVSGSGKSTLISDTLYPIMRKHYFRSAAYAKPYKEIEGLQYLDKVIEIDQSAIGRTPRSNPATYTGLFTLIRNLFAQLQEAKIRGYAPGRFSFNVKGGRCEDCGGAGVKVIEMNFLPDVLVECNTCMGRRYNRETLEVRYKGKSISDVLNMTVEASVDFFENIPQIRRKVVTLNEVGLGYITLGQSSTTLSGGEAQRVKLATELSKRDTGKTFYILDEPTTGLHFEDINILMEVLQKLVNRGNTILIIEHNLDVIKIADYIVDMGPEGGNMGGSVVACGTPEEIIKVKKSITGKYLAAELKGTNVEQPGELNIVDRSKIFAPVPPRSWEK